MMYTQSATVTSTRIAPPPAAVPTITGNGEVWKRRGVHQVMLGAGCIVGEQPIVMLADMAGSIMK